MNRDIENMHVGITCGEKSINHILKISISQSTCKYNARKEKSFIALYGYLSFLWQYNLELEIQNYLNDYFLYD